MFLNWDHGISNPLASQTLEGLRLPGGGMRATLFAGICGWKMVRNNPINDFMPVNFVVEAVWDEDAEVWVAESDDIPGLITEADSRDRLVEKLAVLVPELLELNNLPNDPDQPIDLVLRYRRKAEQREERVRLPKAA